MEGISKAMTVVKRTVYLSLAIDNKLGNYSAVASLKSAILRTEGYNIWVVSGSASTKERMRSD